jgi:hypothetical protein
MSAPRPLSLALAAAAVACALFLLLRVGGDAGHAAAAGARPTAHAAQTPSGANAALSIADQPSTQSARRGVANGAADVLPAVADGAGAITGQVFGADGAPLAGAHCSLWAGTPAGAWHIPAAASAPQAQTSTDAAGRFLLAAPAGHWRLAVRADAHGPWSADHLRAGDHRLVTLSAALRLVVQARDQTGAPVEGVQWQLGRDFHGVPGLDDVAAESDADGRAGLAPLAPGTWYLSSAHAQFLRTQREVQLAAEGPAAPLEVTLLRGLSVSGRVRAAEGAAALVRPRVRIEAFSLGRSEWLELEPDAEGRFASDRRFAPGETLSLFARAEGLAEVPRTVRLPAADGEASEEVSFVLGAPEPRFTGRVVDPERRPLAGVEVHRTATPPVPRGPDGLAQALARVTPHGERWPFEARTGDDGRFEVRGAGGGRQSILALTAPGRAPLFLWPGDPSAAAADGRATDLGDVVLAPAASLAGELRDGAGAPLPSTEVRAQREIVVPGAELDLYRPQSWWRPHSVTTDHRGHFEIGGLAAGTYELFAREQALGAVQVTAGQRSGPLLFTLSAGTELESAHTDLRGTAQDPAGVALEGLFAAVFDAPFDAERRPLAMTFTDVLGRFELTVPVDRELWLSVSDGRARYRETRLVLGRIDRPREEPLVLEPDHTVREPLIGLVRGPTGAPLVGVEVLLEPPQNRWCGCLKIPGRTDDAGYVTFERLGEGPHQVRVRDPEGRLAEQVLPDLAAGQYFEVSLDY